MMNEIKSQIIETPLGNFRVAISSDCELLNFNGKVQLLSENYVSDLPAAMSVDNCRVILMSVNSSEKIKKLSLSCTKFPSEKSIEGADPESGEGLDALSWSGEGHIVMLGTEDEERILSRLENKSINIEACFIEYLSNGLRINIDALPNDKALTLHFAISWNELPEKVDCSCWYAVDVCHENVVSMLL
jgi:hypothetical protein